MADLHKGAEGDVASFRTAALREYKPLAEQGVALAQFNLGIRYDQSRGVPKDDVQAYMWFNLAAAQGDEDAAFTDGRREDAELRDKLAKSMTPDQIAEAQKLSREWAEQHQ